MKSYFNKSICALIFFLITGKVFSQWGQMPDKACYATNALGIPYNSPNYFITDSAAIYSYNTIGGNTQQTTVSYYLCESTDDNSTTKNFLNGFGGLGCCTDKQILPLNKNQVVYSQNSLLSTKIILRTNNSALTVFTVFGFENNFTATFDKTIYCVWKKYTFTNNYMFLNRYINGVTYSDTLKYYGLKTVPKIYFSSDSIGYIYGKDGANQNFIARTNNYGSTWTKVLTPVSDITEIKFEGAIGYSVGFGGLVYQSIDNGMNWVQLPSFTTKKLNSVSMLNTKCYIAGDNATLFHSYDFGVNWIQDTLPVSGKIDWVKVAVNDQVYFQSQNKLYKKGYYSSVNEIDKGEAHNLTIFPNPSSDQIYLRFPSKPGEKYSVTVFDYLGQEIVKADNENQIDIHSIAAGMYSVIVRLTDNKVFTGTFIKIE